MVVGCMDFVIRCGRKDGTPGGAHPLDAHHPGRCSLGRGSPYDDVGGRIVHGFARSYSDSE